MCSSPQNPSDRQRRMDLADRLGTCTGWAVLLAVGGCLSVFGGRDVLAPRPGEVRIFPEIRLHLAPVSMPEIEAPPVESVAPPLPEAQPEPEPEPEPEAKPPEPEPRPEPEVVPPPPEAAPVPASQAVVEKEGEAGKQKAIQAEWLTELRQRIEQSKFYPGTARYSRETGTVLLRVEIRSTGEIGEARILENSGSVLLAEGAQRILRRAAKKPLGTNMLPAGFEVDVPITYRIERR